MQENDATVNVVDPFGKVGSLPKAEASEALANGYKLPTSDELTTARNEERFGGAQGAVFSSVLGAARAATIGLSDLALTKLPAGVGFSPEELRGFKETNPVATTLGEVGSVFSDPLGVFKAIGTAGKAATAGAKTVLKSAINAEDASIVTRTLSNAFGHGVEGGLYGGVLNSVDDMAMGDPSLNGEKVMANVGLGALTGGATGGLLSALSFGLTPTIKRAVSGLSDLRDELIGSGYGEDGLISKVLPNRFSEALADRQLNLDVKGQASVLRRVTTNLNWVVDSVKKEISDFESEVDPSAVSALFKSASKQAGEAQKAVAEQVSGLMDHIGSLVPDGPTKEALLAMKNKANFGNLLNGSAQDIFNSMKRLKASMSNFIEKEPELAEAITPLRDGINETLKDPKIFGAAGAASAMHDENIGQLAKFISEDSKLTPFQKTFGEVENGKWQFDIKKMHEVLSDTDPVNKAANLQMLNDFYDHLKDMPENLMNARKVVPNSSWKSQTLKQIVENSEKTKEQAFEDYIKGVDKRRPLYGWKDYAPVLIAKWHPVIAAAIEAYDFYQDPVHASHELALVERILGKVTSKSLSMIDEIFNPSNVSKVIINKSRGKDIGPVSTDEHDDIKKYASNPESLMEALSKSTKGLYESAPNISQHLQLQASNAINFLSSKLPMTDDGNNPLVNKPHDLSPTELATFNRYKTIVKDPLHALRQVKLGTITPETTETLMAVYPKLYEQMKQSVIEKAFLQKSLDKPIPYKTRQAISMFLMQPMDSSLSPQSIWANQATISAANVKEQQGMQPQGKVRAKGLDNMDASGRSQNKYGLSAD